VSFVSKRHALIRKGSSTVHADGASWTYENRKTGDEVVERGGIVKDGWMGGELVGAMR
jgi:hypothetical protein